MTIRGVSPLNCGLVLVALLASAAFVGCGGSEPAGPAGPAGPDSTVVKAREAAHQEKLKLQEEQKAKRGR